MTHIKNIPRVAVIIPCYKVRKHILDVISKIDQNCWKIYVIDDQCPEHSGQFVIDQSHDERIEVLFNPANLGVGGAVMAGYKKALSDGADIMVKIDGDGQIDPSLIPNIIEPLLRGTADYAKGNRFFDLDNLHGMPAIRIFGNAVLSFFNKVSSGYWNIFDPTNGFTAIRSEVARKLPFEKISNRYFFESDILFRLNTIRAVVEDVAIAAHYGDETSNLKIRKIIGEFLYKHIRNSCKRIIYNYFLRDMSLASLELVVGVISITGGSLFGVVKWIHSIGTGIPTTAGSVMLAALPIILGLQFLLSFLGYDIANVPRRPRSSPFFNDQKKFSQFQNE